MIGQFGSAAQEDYLWGAEQLLDAVGLWPLPPKIQAAMPWLMSFTMSMIPGWGDLDDLASAAMGYDMITGQHLAGWQRWLTVAAVLIPFISGAELRASDNFLEAEADLAKSFERGCSFDEDTPVATKQGEKPIRDIGIGDQVLAWDEQTHTTGYYTVTATMAHIDPQIVHLIINGETIETTPEHPFYVVVHDSWLPLVERGEWVAAGELQVDDAIRKADGTSSTVSQVNVTADPQVMYNLTVDTVHTYVVGDGQWVVHNTVCRLNIGDIHFTQAKYSTSGKKADGTLYYVADNVQWLLDNPGLDLPWGGEIEVFVKRPFMDKWGPMVYKDYVGDPINLANDLIYTLDNRRLATYVLAERETVPVQWAELNRIRKKRYEFDTRNFGLWIEPRIR